MKTFIITLGAFIVCCGALPQDINLSGDNSDFLEEEKRSLREPKQVSSIIIYLCEKY